jgi:hypothetical protein
MVNGTPKWSLPLMVVVRDGSTFCHMRKLWSMNEWCIQKIGSLGLAETSDITAPMPSWP